VPLVTVTLGSQVCPNAEPKDQSVLRV
jgi:hypothetical protein